MKRPEDYRYMDVLRAIKARLDREEEQNLREFRRGRALRDLRKWADAIPGGAGDVAFDAIVGTALGKNVRLLRSVPWEGRGNG